MAATLLGADALVAMLAGRGAITITNYCSSDETMRIMAAAVVRHEANGGVAAESAFGLDLAPAESEIFEPIDARQGALEAVEVLLRVFSEASGTLSDVYLSGQASGSGSSVGWEAGLRDTAGPMATGEVEVPEFPGVVAHLREVLSGGA
jgi:hypothetical protein